MLQLFAPFKRFLPLMQAPIGYHLEQISSLSLFESFSRVSSP